MNGPIQDKPRRVRPPNSTPAPWTNQRRAQYVRPNGRHDRAALARLLPKLRGQGLTLKQIAEFTGISHSVWKNANVLTDHCPEGRLILADLAATTGVSWSALREFVKDNNIPFQRFGKKISLSLEDAQRISEFYSRVLTADPDPEEWWHITRLAAFFGCTTDAVHLRFRSGTSFAQIRRRRLVGQVGNLWRYNAEDARRVRNALPLALSKPPVGTLSTAEVAALIHVNHRVVAAYTKKGCPHIRVQRGQVGLLYFRPAELREWFLEQAHSTHHRHARTLARALEQQRAA